MNCVLSVQNVDIALIINWTKVICISEIRLKIICFLTVFIIVYMFLIDAIAKLDYRICLPVKLFSFRSASLVLI